MYFLEKHNDVYFKKREDIKNNKNEYILELIDMVSLFQIDFLLDFNEKFISLLTDVPKIKLEKIIIKSTLKS